MLALTAAGFSTATELAAVINRSAKLSYRTAHRIVGYLEEEAVVSYTQYLEEIDAGRVENVPAPEIALEYWNLPKGARLREVVEVIRADEAAHRDVNHGFADRIAAGDHP